MYETVCPWWIYHLPGAGTQTGLPLSLLAANLVLPQAVSYCTLSNSSPTKPPSRLSAHCTAIIWISGENQGVLWWQYIYWAHFVVQWTLSARTWQVIAVRNSSDSFAPWKMGEELITLSLPVLDQAQFQWLSQQVKTTDVCSKPVGNCFVQSRSWANFFLQEGEVCLFNPISKQCHFLTETIAEMCAQLGYFRPDYIFIFVLRIKFEVYFFRIAS